MITRRTFLAMASAAVAAPALAWADVPPQGRIETLGRLGPGDAQLVSIWPDYFARLGSPRGRRLWLHHGTRVMDAGMAERAAYLAARLRPG